MKTIKTILLFTLLLALANYVNAQEKKMYATFRKLINVNDSLFFSDEFNERAVFFSLNMFVNGKGIIDSVVLSNEKNEYLNRLINMPKIISELKKNKTDFVEHKNEILVLMVMIARGEQYFTRFKNGEEIINNWNNISLMAKKNSDTQRKQVFLGTIMTTVRAGRQREKF